MEAAFDADWARAIGYLHLWWHVFEDEGTCRMCRGASGGRHTGKIGRPRSARSVEIERRLEAGAKYREIAVAMDCTTGYVAYVAKTRGLTRA